MERSFSQTMSELRRERGLSQRRVASDLNISQALLSHYENGTREPGLPFLCRACQYYGVTSDYMLGLADRGDNAREREELSALAERLRALADEAEMALGSAE